MIVIDDIFKDSLKDFTFIDLFAGIGGFHLALNSFGAKCVFASEWDKHSAETYEINFNMKPHGDITLIDEKEIPQHDILCGGFPCQAFSISGKQKGFEDTRGTLFFDIARIINHHNPKFLFLENVKNLSKHDNGKTLNTIIETLNELNYQVEYKVLNASHYGLPQNRERIYIIGIRKDLNFLKFKFPKPKNFQVSLLDILEENPINTKIVIRDDIKFYKKIDEFDLFGNKNTFNKPLQIGKVNKGGQGERIYHTHGHSITLSAYGGGVGAKTGLYYVDGKVRKLSPRECARVQGFPESFVINKSASQCYKQFGNSVSINVLQYITEEIFKTII
ncbi:MAG: DNA cytosine methyltransferase [Paludibacter sp.]|nr:DNA cytosine methyltransferase [Paludibacter sp.]